MRWLPFPTAIPSIDVGRAYTCTVYSRLHTHPCFRAAILGVGVWVREPNEGRCDAMDHDRRACPIRPRDDRSKGWVGWILKRRQPHAVDRKTDRLAGPPGLTQHYSTGGRSGTSIACRRCAPPQGKWRVCTACG
ncbi:hypothetical protein BU23DRAFT_270030 [Bimuria novae-zelandiae CBS 107.79]|uniref:Uncharacterized protein n=1 Tax=Bimuria novae-zelandiae CBS 107.79 TaxID=1447943 RepID=A0A6A5UWD7_9PLEO|nr:hypothetical protein BU23DRAFT_270030 [Bimuria novae-zelandiae CBS 107.79]